MQNTTYTPGSIESKWYEFWLNNDYFKANQANLPQNAATYSIMLPPPNVTGTLHMGHGFQHTLQDALIRYHRMRGFNTLWQPGTDHAGIATQIVVERLLEQQGLSRKQIGRDEFEKKVWQWRNLSGNTISSQMKRLGASCDWSKERFTMDNGLSKAVVEVFVRLFDQGYIYKGSRLVNWDVKLQSAVSDLEVVSVEEQGSMWYIRYELADNSNEYVIVATTRPETMFGDVAVAVNPNDDRYQHLIGKQLKLPLAGRYIPIIADDYVDASFGTGCVKITPAHDFNDYALAKRHNLEMINILDKTGHLNNNVPTNYQGLERFIARTRVIKDLEASGELQEIKPHKLMVPRSERTDVIIEPLLTEQWFMRMDEFAEQALTLVRDKQIRFIPDNWSTTYNQWLEGIQDWCISRQLWWGHRIPAYYDEAGNIYVARSLEEAQQQAKTTILNQDDDVLDTWFSSALWCFSTLGWPDSTPELKQFLPTSVLVTGFDIIFFWVARMVMLTKHFTTEIPFKDVYITGLILDTQGNKMSKSKGNIIDPIDIIDGISLDDLVIKRTQNLMNPKEAEKIAKKTRLDYPNGFSSFGADALRWTFASQASHGREVRFDIKKIENSRNFCNKIWNATRFVLMNVKQNIDLIKDINQAYPLSLIDNWILVALKQLIIDVDLAYQTYRFDIATHRIYEFFWNDYCDWYLELARVNLQDDKLKLATTKTLLQVLEISLRLMHPFIPFITEELWQEIAGLANMKATKSIVIANYPKVSEILCDNSMSEARFNILKNLIITTRSLRVSANLAPNVKVPLLIETTQDLNDFIPYIQSLAKVSDVTIVEKITEANTALISVLSFAKLSLIITIDKQVEELRLQREIIKNNKELDKVKAKLTNPTFTIRAPKNVVDETLARLAELELVINELNQQLNNL